MERNLVNLCIEAATESAAAVDKWRRQRRTLERMPFQLGEALLHRLARRRILFPSLLEVFKYSVAEIDLRGESRVDAEWMAYLGAFQYLSSLFLADCHKINDSALWCITGMISLKEVDLSRCSKITDGGVKHLLSIPALEKLSISETGVTADGVALLAALTNLLVLDLGGLPVTDSALGSLQVLTKLEHLDLWGSEVSNKGVTHLKLLPKLRFLSLAWTSVTELPNLSSLACLDMSNCTVTSLFEGNGRKAQLEKLVMHGATISDPYEVFQYVETNTLCFLDISNSSLDSFYFLSSMEAMSHLNLGDSSLVDNSVEHISYIGANLQYLDLCNTRISSKGIGALAGLVPNLETILLAGTLVDDTVILYLSMMPALKFINLSRTNVKGGLLHQEGNVPDEVPSLFVLKNLSHLEKLDLEEIQIKDIALGPLASLGRLSYLSLRTDSLTDASLDLASCVSELIHFSVRDALLTNAGIDSFVPPPKLEVLDLRGCWLLTKDCLLYFCQKHPQIKVRHELVTTLDKGNTCCLSPPRHIMSSKPKRKQKKLLMRIIESDEIFLDQRLKYSRDELLSMQFSSAAISTSNPPGNFIRHFKH
ncbi:toll-like receptor 3-like [Dorcoceras hygrometricum]|uniref:Toll-like receptor 3-like n=1 Tax=Dorcoceras hygrometricum TaxID=472368 RepID=A0A2Z7BB28_9LAMI|nr:toll-like receptor 3-like [Dorcoceras hygrometricum]